MDGSSNARDDTGVFRGYPVPSERATERVATLDQFVAAIASSRLRRLLEYWRGRFQADLPPARSDLDPTEIPDLLASLYLLDALDGGSYRFRLAGTRLRELFNADPTGLSLAECLPELDLSRAEASYAEVIANKGAWYSDNLYRRPNGSPLRYQRLALALSPGKAGSTTERTRILGGIVWESTGPGDKGFAAHFREFTGLADRRAIFYAPD